MSHQKWFLLGVPATEIQRFTDVLVEKYYAIGYVTATDIFSILEIPKEDWKNYELVVSRIMNLKDEVARERIKRKVEEFAADYYGIFQDIDDKKSQFTYLHSPERIIKAGDVIPELLKPKINEYWNAGTRHTFKDLLNNNYVHDNLKEDIGMSSMKYEFDDQEKVYVRKRYYDCRKEDGIVVGGKYGAIQKAERELAELTLRQGYLTKQDVNHALGIKSNNPSDSMILFKAEDFPFSIPEHVKNDIRYYAERAYDSVYHRSENLPDGLSPIRMWQNGGYTTVEWNDHTKTTVKAENEETMTTYGGFCACVAKKLYDSTSNGIRFMNNALAEAEWPAKRKQIEREKLKELKLKKAENAKKNRERYIRDRMDEMAIEQEAARRLAQQKDGEK